MQREKNMDKTLKFVYFVILFLSLFLLITISNSFQYHVVSPCLSDKDCFRTSANNIRCRKGFCVPI
ncbi:putative Late nodulin [Medicago truncatula]|uniref:Leginsulin/Albumin-1 n=1 Tax=Medicago truncatula TaxID=3880 RepID=A0A072TXW8_MEDTR|nr:Leginsulin/Albumin-1 [Medicago truncatula]RHN44997.1 putative Late nodulin [Medicago truncatula]